MGGNKVLGSTGEFFRRRDEWRKHPMLSNQFRHALPGLGLGVSAFVVYCIAEAVYDKFFSNPSSSSSSSSHH